MKYSSYDGLASVYTYNVRFIIININKLSIIINFIAVAYFQVVLALHFGVLLYQCIWANNLFNILLWTSIAMVLSACASFSRIFVVIRIFLENWQYLKILKFILQLIQLYTNFIIIIVLNKFCYCPFLSSPQSSF